jgi:hypothetical protein
MQRKECNQQTGSILLIKRSFHTMETQPIAEVFFHQVDALFPI